MVRFPKRQTIASPSRPSSLGAGYWVLGTRYSQLLRRHPINLFQNRRPVYKPAALQNCFAVCDHVGMSAQVGRGIRGVEFPVIGVFAQHVVGAADLSWPVGVIPGTAHSGHILEPWQFRIEVGELLFVAELPGTAGAVQQVEPVAAVEAAFLPVSCKGADKTDER